MDIEHTYSSSEIAKAATIFQELNSKDSNALASINHYSFLAGGYMLLLQTVFTDKDYENSDSVANGGIEMISRNTSVYIDLLNEVSNVSVDDLSLLLKVMISSRINKDLQKQFTEEIDKIEQMIKNSN